MAYGFEQFCADCNEALKRETGRAGKEAVRRNLERLLADADFLRERFGAKPPNGRHIIHHDKETDMFVLVHAFDEEGDSAPHDHGSYWVIYGQAAGYTDMTDWRRVDDGRREGHAELEVERKYRVDPGQAEVFDAGKIHSIRYPANSCFVRVTSGDVESGRNLRFDVENRRVEVQDRGKEDRVSSRATA